MTREAHDISPLITNDHQRNLGRKYNEIFRKYHDRYNDTTEKHGKHRSRSKGNNKTSSPSNDDSSRNSRNRSQSEPVVFPRITQPASPGTNNSYFQNTPIRLRIFNDLAGEKKISTSLPQASPSKGFQHKGGGVPLSHDSLLWNSSQIYERLRKGKRRTPVSQGASDDTKGATRRGNGNRYSRYKKDLILKHKDDTASGEIIQTSFNIREKIEQFREWHEKECKNKLDHLKQNNHKDVERLPAIDRETKGKLVHKNTREENNESRTTNKRISTGTKLPQDGKTESKDSALGSPQPSESVNRAFKQKAKQPHDKRTNNAVRKSSAKSWKTWRGVNDSYAYDDVYSYIKDNDLMTKDKETWIHSWLDQALQVQEKGLTEDVDSDSSLTDEADDLFP